MNKNTSTINCPNCGTEIEITEVLAHEIESRLTADLEKKYKDKLIYEKENAEKNARSEMQALQNDLLAQLKERDETISNTNAKFEDLLRKENELEEDKRRLNITILERVEIEKKIIEQNVKEKIESENKVKDEEIKKLNEDLTKSKEVELKFLLREKELDRKSADLELIVQQKLIDEKKSLIREVEERKENDFSLKMREKDHQIESMNKMILDLKQKSEQGSMQTQGEAQELEIEETLKRAFPIDEIIPVPKGVKGADCIQKVHNRLGQTVGIILWESKRTKSWSKDWISKLINDKTEINAEIGIIVSQVLPENIKHIGVMDGIWVTDFINYLELTQVLREWLIQLNSLKSAQQGKDQKMDMLYDYLTGNDFKMRIENIVKSFVNMREELEKEKTSMNKIWKSREKQIEIVMKNTTSMYGSLEGIIGKSLPAVSYFELPEADIEIFENDD